LSIVTDIGLQSAQPAFEKARLDQAAFHRAALQIALPVTPRLSFGVVFSLMKPRVMSLVVFTALTGMFAAPGHISPVRAIIAILAIALGAGASGALNMWYDADIDAIMTRTAKRPVPSGRVSAEDTLSLGLVLSFIAIAVLTLATNWIAGGLLAFTIFFYAVVYTIWLKRSTPQNIVIGGAAGAFPPMIGYAAVGGSLNLESLILFLIIFIWTPPHFWALALIKAADYAKAGIPMMPNVRGPASTRLQILVYTLLLVPLGIAPTLLGYAGSVALATGLIGGIGMLILAARVYALGDGPLATKASWQLFGGSILYLFLVFAALLGEKLVSIGFSA
jgi:protoheme IX farnesyltransferase